MRTYLLSGPADAKLFLQFTLPNGNKVTVSANTDYTAVESAATHIGYDLDRELSRMAQFLPVIAAKMAILQGAYKRHDLEAEVEALKGLAPYMALALNTLATKKGA